MVFITLEEAKENLVKLKGGDRIAFQLKNGRIRIGSTRIKDVRCGKKNCSKCPHQTYIYARYRIGKKVTERYIGKIN
ncbi:hypothetical protein LCGC14_3103410 [marine sediment metagenome]|uniref:DUF6788 domain-containing protein n=1 Tax=marine sediment metagenome TaxID=412755 RepID=A0A0F8YEK4_9ZZZZ